MSKLNRFLLGLPSPLAMEIKLNSTIGNLIYTTNDKDDLYLSALTEFRDWEPTSLKLFSILSQEGELALDVGAYSGLYSLVCAMSNSKILVHAYEPNPIMRVNTTKNILMNGFDEQILVKEFALSSKSGTRRLHLNNQLGWTSGASLSNGVGDYLECNTETLDQLYSDQEVDLIKIDVEGHECEVLKGGRELLLRDRPRVVMEALSIENLKAQIDFMSKLRYRPPVQIGRANWESDSRNYLWLHQSDYSSAEALIKKAAHNGQLFKFINATVIQKGIYNGI